LTISAFIIVNNLLIFMNFVVFFGKAQLQFFQVK